MSSMGSDERAKLLARASSIMAELQLKLVSEALTGTRTSPSDRIVCPLR